MPQQSRGFAEKLTFLRRYSSVQDADLVVARARELGITHAEIAWLERVSADQVPVSEAEQRALAQALAVPAEYFTGTGTTAVVDAVLVLAAELRARNVEVIGPCRHGPVTSQDYLALYAALLWDVMLPHTE